MENKKILVIIPIIIIIIILLGAGVFAYIFFKTDLLKSDRQLFFEYALGDKSGEVLKEYYKKQLETPYEFVGRGYVEVESDIDEIPQDFKDLEKFEKFDITFEGVNDIKAQNFDIKASVNYDHEKIIPVSVAKTGSLLGITTDALDGYIAIDYEEDAKNSLGLEKMAKIMVDYIYQEREELSKEDIEYLKEKYMDILMESLTDEKFSKVTAEEETGYRLEITNKELIETFVKVLEELKDDEKTLDIINGQLEKTIEITEENLNGVPTEDMKLEKQDIEEIIDEINENVLTIPEYSEESEQEFKDTLNRKIIVILWVDNNKNISKVEVSQEKLGKIEIEIKRTEDTLEYVGTVDISERISEISTLIDEDMEIEKIKVIGNFGVKYTGLNTMEKVTELYHYGMSLSQVEEADAKIYVENAVKFTETPDISTLDEDNTWLLTPNTDEAVLKFLEKKYELVMKDFTKRFEALEDVLSSSNKILQPTPGMLPLDDIGESILRKAAI